MKAELSDFSRVAVENLFYAKILALEDKKGKGAYSKVEHLDLLQKELQLFISLHPRGKFQIKTYDGDSEVTLVVMNCPTESIRNEYEVKIDSDWVGLIVNQLNEDASASVIIHIV